MNLEELVPPLELCQKIPAGEFADSAFYWFEELQKINEKPPHDYRYFVCFADFRGYAWGGGRCCPAPTLQEILRETQPGDTAVFCCHHGGGSWSMGDSEQDLYVKNGFEGKNPAEIALRWWLKQKGIE